MNRDHACGQQVQLASGSGQTATSASQGVLRTVRKQSIQQPQLHWSRELLIAEFVEGMDGLLQGKEWSLITHAFPKEESNTMPRGAVW